VVHQVATGQITDKADCKLHTHTSQISPRSAVLLWSQEISSLALVAKERKPTELVLK